MDKKQKALNKARPRSLTIGGLDWSIVWHTEKTWEKGEHDTKSSGETFTWALTIHVLVNEGLNPVCEREVFVHELMHACVATSGHAYTMGHIKKGNAEEVLIQGMSPMMLGVLRNNPHIVEYLLAPA